LSAAPCGRSYWPPGNPALRSGARREKVLHNVRSTSAPY
jgi:hypothetical protein